MKTTIKKINNKKYNRPEITKIKIDGDTSILMSSANWNDDPEESFNINPFNNDPFKINKA